MFQRAGFLGPVRLASSVRRPPARRLGGMLEDYQNEINALKDKLSRLQKPYMQPEPPPSAFPAAPPYPPPPPPPPPPSGQLNCYTRPDGSAYWGYPDGVSTPNNLTEFQCMGAANPRPVEPPEPPSVTSEVDYPGTGMPPISVEAGDEVPPPVPNPPAGFPGGHPPVVTGIPGGEEGHPPYSYPPQPTEEQLRECPVGTVWAAPGDTCPPNMDKTIPGSDCCYPRVSSVSRYPSWYPPTTTEPVTAPNLFESGYNTSSFQGLPFSGDSGVSAPMLTGRRRYPVVNLRPRRML